MKYPTWIYHATEEPIIVDAHETNSYYKTGWAATPAKFLNNKDEIQETTLNPGLKVGRKKNNLFKTD